MNLLNKKDIKNGFTLIELLLVMAIIGILAGVIMVGIGSSRKRAKVTANLKTADSVAAELADCYLNNKTTAEWTDTHSGGGKICSGAGEWPKLTDGCNYSSYTGNILTIDCSEVGANIICDVADGNCEVENL